MKSARLIVTYKCNHDCSGCCNKQLNKSEIPEINSIEELKDYDEILITGGEPFLFPEKLKELIKEIKKNGNQKIIIYTTPEYTIEDFNEISKLVDGITITIHNEDDLNKFQHRLVYFDNITNIVFLKDKSLRLNVFNPIKSIIFFCLEIFYWKVKYIDWIENCPLPENETLYQLKQLWR